MSVPQRPGRAEIGGALALLFGGTLLLAVLAFALPMISVWLQAFLAVLLLGVPSVVLRRWGAGATIDDMGVDPGPWPRTLGASALTMAFIIPPFLWGHHIVQTRGLDRTADWSLHSLERWDDTAEGMPAAPCGPRRAEGITAWIAGDSLWILPPPDRVLVLDYQGMPRPAPPRDVRCGPDGLPAAHGALAVSADRPAGPDRTTRGHGAMIPLREAAAIDVRVGLAAEGGGPTDFDGPVLTGAFRTTAEAALSLARDLWWLPTFLIVHLGLVALPEEWFFRGYLQTRLDQRFGTPRRLFGAPVGVGLLLSALAFALLHPILIPGVHRLLVFFPALLFGWLRARTGNIGAAVVVHASCNLLQAVAVEMY